MGIGLSDAVEPLGTFAIAKDIHLQGGYRSVADAAERDAITAARRSEGMLVYTRDDNTMWRLGPGLTNGDWVEHVTRGLITVQNDTGTPIGVRSTLMIEGASVLDEPGNNRIRITIPVAPPAVIEVQEEGFTVGNYATINFKGPGVTAVDNADQGRVDVTVNAVNSTDNGLAFRTWQKGKMSPAPGAEVTAQSFAASGGGPSVVHFNNVFIYHVLEGLNEQAIRYFDPMTGTGGILNPGPGEGSAFTDLCAVTNETAGNLLAIVEPNPGAVQIYNVSFAISPTNGTVTPTFSFVTTVNGVNGGRAVAMGHYLLVTHPNADNLAYIDLRNGYATGTAVTFASDTAPLAVAVDMSGAEPRVWVSTNTNVFGFRFTGTFPLTPDLGPGLIGGQLHMEFDGRYLWANDGSVIEAVDPTTQTSVLSLQTPVLQPNDYSKLTFDGKSIWTSGNCDGTPSIVRLAAPDGIVAKYPITATSVRAAGVNDVGDIAVCTVSDGAAETTFDSYAAPTNLFALGHERGGTAHYVEAGNPFSLTLLGQQLDISQTVGYVRLVRTWVKIVVNSPTNNDNQFNLVARVDGVDIASSQIAEPSPGASTYFELFPDFVTDNTGPHTVSLFVDKVNPTEGDTINWSVWFGYSFREIGLLPGTGPEHVTYARASVSGLNTNESGGTYEIHVLLNGGFVASLGSYPMGTSGPIDFEGAFNVAVEAADSLTVEPVQTSGSGDPPVVESYTFEFSHASTAFREFDGLLGPSNGDITTLTLAYPVEQASPSTALTFELYVNGSVAHTHSMTEQAANELADNVESWPVSPPVPITTTDTLYWVLRHPDPLDEGGRAWRYSGTLTVSITGGSPQMGLTVLRDVGDSTQRDARFNRLSLPELSDGPIGMVGGVVANVNAGVALSNQGFGVTNTRGVIALSGEDYEMIPNASVASNGLSIHSNAGVGNASARALGATRDIFIEPVTTGVGSLIGSGGVPTGTGRVRRLVEGRGFIFATDDADETFLRGFDTTTLLPRYTIDGGTFAWAIGDLGSFFYVGPDQSGNDMFVGTSTDSNVLSRFTPTTVLNVSNPTTGATFGTVQGCPIRTYTSTPDIYAEDQILGVFLGDDGQLWLTDDLTTGSPVTATGTGLNVAQATFMHSVWGYNLVPALRRTENGYLPGQSPYGMRSVVYFTQPTSGVLTATHSLMCYDLQANTLTLVGGTAGLIPPGVRNLAFDGHYLWGYGHNGQPRLHKINPYTGKVIRSVAVPIGNTTHARTHWDGKFIWVTGDAHTGFGNTDNIAKVDPDKGEVIARATIGSTTHGLIGSGFSDDVFVTTDTGLYRIYNRQPLAGNGLTVRGAEVHAGVQTVTTSTYTVDADDHHLLVAAPVGGTVITLPASVPVGYTLYVSDVSGNASSRNISLTRQGAHTIIGLTSYVLTIDYASIKLRYVGSNLWVVL